MISALAAYPVSVQLHSRVFLHVFNVSKLDKSFEVIFCVVSIITSVRMVEHAKMSLLVVKRMKDFNTFTIRGFSLKDNRFVMSQNMMSISYGSG